MSKRNVLKSEIGFTLVELLVVIAIIALLLSILMPALAKVKEQARMVVCKSNVKQWGLVFMLYTQDSDGHFMPGLTTTAGTIKPIIGDQWPDALQKYYKNPKMRLCPNTRKTATEMPTTAARLLWPQTTDQAWGTMAEGDERGWGIGRGNFGSYAINAWAYDPRPECDTYKNYIPGVDAYLRKLPVNMASDTPLMLDSLWVEMYPTRNDAITLIHKDVFGDAARKLKGSMVRATVLRHPDSHKLNAVFMDGSARDFKIKNLWNLRWHNGYKDPQISDDKFPSWMK